MEEQDILKLKSILSEITDYIPEKHMRDIWRACNIIRGERVPQPCGCPSAAGNWIRCINDLRNFLNTYG